MSAETEAILDELDDVLERVQQTPDSVDIGALSARATELRNIVRGPGTERSGITTRHSSVVIQRLWIV